MDADDMISHDIFTWRESPNDPMTQSGLRTLEEILLREQSPSKLTEYSARVFFAEGACRGHISTARFNSPKYFLPTLMVSLQALC